MSTVPRYNIVQVDPLVYNMSHEDPGDISYSEIGGLGEQIRELRFVVVSPLFFENQFFPARFYMFLKFY